MPVRHRIDGLEITQKRDLPLNQVRHRIDGLENYSHDGLST